VLTTPGSLHCAEVATRIFVKLGVTIMGLPRKPEQPRSEVAKE